MVVIILSAFLFSGTAFAQKVKLTDPEIASTAVTANQIDINQAAVAKQRSKNIAVLHFAETMANDHKAIIAQVVALVTKLKVTPKDNAVSRKLNADAVKTIALLKTKSGKDFDRAYIDNEVIYHKTLISVLKRTLIPAATDAELKELLKKVVPALKVHLEHAEMIQKELK